MPRKELRKALPSSMNKGSQVRAALSLAGRPAQRGLSQTGEKLGLRERKKARLRQQIIDTSVRLFRKRGYENTRVEDIVQLLEISEPTFFRYFPSKDAVLREVGRLGFRCMNEHLQSELSCDASAGERLSRLYEDMAREVVSDRPLWRAIVLSGAMDPVRSPEMRRVEEIACTLLTEILKEGQKRGEITRVFPLPHLAQFMQALYRTTVRHWAVDLPAPHNLGERVRSAVRFFLEGAKP